MFCQKCGKEMNDGAMFCVSCGAKLGEANAQDVQNNVENVQAQANEQTNVGNEPVQGAQPQQQKSGEVPPIIANLKKFGLGFFTKKDPVGIVAESMDDSSWSGIILAGAYILLSALILLISFNSSTKGMDLGGIGGKIFLLSFVMNAVVFFVTAGGMFILINNFLKKKISFSGAVNLVAYSSIIMFCVTILNLIINMIWWPLAVLLSIVALLATILLIYSAIDAKYELGKSLFVPYTCVMTVVIAITLLVAYLCVKSLLSDMMGILRYLL